jgi:hypothetical protein
MSRLVGLDSEALLVQPKSIHSMKGAKEGLRRNLGASATGLRRVG